MSYDPYDHTWMDSNGKICPVVKLEDAHLLNIQAFLSRQLKNLHPLVSAVNNLADRYSAEYSDKEWFSDPEYVDEDDMRGEIKIALMKISQEVNRRGLKR